MFGKSRSRSYHVLPGYDSCAFPGRINRSTLGTLRSKLVFTLRQFQEGSGPEDSMGFGSSAPGLHPRPEWAWARGLDGIGPKGSMGFGSLVPYNSPPLIHTRLPRRIKVLLGPFSPGNLLAWDFWLSLLIKIHLKRRAVSRRQAQSSLLPDGS